jgi:hypothetical protein
MKLLRLLANLYLTGFTTLALFSNSASMQTTESGCVGSPVTTDSNSVAICFTSPADNASLTGDAHVAVATNLVNESSDIQSIVFSLNKDYLLTDYSSTYAFTLPTEKWADGTYTILAVVHLRSSITMAHAQISVKFNNGNATAPVNPNHFTPSTGTIPANGQPFVVAASGDGASGEAASTSVINKISSLNPNLFLYLGDVYESGSVAEFYNWYGTDSTNFSALRAITDPTIGNHEYTNGINGDGYFDYWDNIPDYYSFNAGGWHFISLNSNLTKLGGNPPGLAEYNWLAHDLAANPQTCTIAYYHQPLFNIGAEGPTQAMARFWALLANFKVPIVLNGHDHDYQRWVPLDGSGNPSPNGITEFVAGGAGHGLQEFITSDSRVAYSNDTNPTAFGVLLLQLSQTSANFSYHSSDGSILDSGFIPCISGASDNSSSSVQPATANIATATLVEAPSATLIPSATMVDTDTDSPVPSATDVVTNKLLPTTTLVGTDTPAPTSTTTPIAVGGVALGGVALLLLLAGLIIFARRRV